MAVGPTEESLLDDTFRQRNEGSDASMGMAVMALLLMSSETRRERREKSGHADRRLSLASRCLSTVCVHTHVGSLMMPFPDRSTVST